MRKIPTPTSARDDEYLLRFVLKKTTAELLVNKQETLPPRAADRLNRLKKMRADGVPIQYIVGEAWFYGLKFFVSPAVLIPRPETELLIDRARAQRPRANWTIIDVGTGSGAIAITLATHHRNTVVIATDISSDALRVARQNARRHHTPIVFMKKNLLAGVPWPRTKKVLVAANLPYLSAAQIQHLAAEVKHEPRCALYGGSQDGLKLYKKMLSQIHIAQRPQQKIILLAEIEPTQQKKFAALVRRELPSADTTFHRDLHGDVRLAEIILF